MTNDPQHRSDVASVELLEGAGPLSPSVVPVAVPVSPLRSPIMEHRPIEPLPADDGRPTVLLPPLRAFIGPSGLALLIASPVLLVAGLQAALIVAVVAPMLQEIHRRASRSTFSFGDGFLPYRADPGWPRGVQEEDEVRWNWTPTGGGRGVHG